MIKFSFLVNRRQGMSFEEFTAYHKNIHAPLFSSIPETAQYVRKYVITHAIEKEGFPKPLCDSITQIYFDSFEDYHTFFASENYLKKVHPDESNFLDMGSIGVVVTNETVIL